MKHRTSFTYTHTLVTLCGHAKPSKSSPLTACINHETASGCWDYPWCSIILEQCPWHCNSWHQQTCWRTWHRKSQVVLMYQPWLVMPGHGWHCRTKKTFHFRNKGWQWLMVCGRESWSILVVDWLGDTVIPRLGMPVSVGATTKLWIFCTWHFEMQAI